MISLRRSYTAHFLQEFTPTGGQASVGHSYAMLRQQPKDNGRGKGRSGPEEAPGRSAVTFEGPLDRLD